MGLHQHLLRNRSPCLKTLLGELIFFADSVIVYTTECEDDGTQNSSAVLSGCAVEEEGFWLIRGGGGDVAEDLGVRGLGVKEDVCVCF